MGEMNPAFYKDIQTQRKIAKNIFNITTEKNEH